MASEAGKVAGWRRGLAATMPLASPAWAGRPDYSHLSDAELQRVVIVNSLVLAAMALLGLYGWWRYRRQFVPGQGGWTPRRVLLLVSAAIALVVYFALRQLGFL